MLELENALGGDPGPGLGADSDFDKRQLEKVIFFGQIDGCNLAALASLVEFTGWVLQVKLRSLVITRLVFNGKLFFPPGGLRQPCPTGESFCCGTRSSCKF